MSRKFPFKPRTTFRKRSKNRKPGDVLTRPDFCVRNAISEGLYFKLKREGRGPREIEIGNRIIITPEAEADWRLEREAETMAKRREREAAALQDTA